MSATESARGSALSEVVRAVAYFKLAVLPVGTLYFMWGAIRNYWSHRYHSEEEIELYHAGAMVVLRGAFLIPLQLLLLTAVLQLSFRRAIRVPWVVILAACWAGGPIVLLIEESARDSRFVRDYQDILTWAAPSLIVMAACAFALPPRGPR